MPENFTVESDFMAIQSVQFKLNGQTYNLSFDSSAGVYKATVTAPATTS